MIDSNLKTIADTFGSKQVMKLVEEMAELTQAIARVHNNDNEENSLHIIEEMADVEIVLEQLKYLLRSQDDFEIIKQQKIQRTLERIESGYYKE
jgi:NTP pyrophosphatase (non-canonical NTP hydrolase)